MGTNYYWITEAAVKCETCGHSRPRQSLHIGKSSGGWEFGFHSPNPQIISWEQWQKALKGEQGYIEDEEGYVITFAGFKSIVENRGDGLLSHYDEMVKEGYEVISDWKDDEGYSFCRNEFC